MSKIIAGRALRRDQSTAFHEAGHAVAHYFQRRHFKLVTIEGADGTHGHVMCSKPIGAPPDDEHSGRYLRWVDSAERTMTILLCGPLAQVRHRQSSYRHFHGSSDHECVAEIATHVAGFGGKVFDAYMAYRIEIAKHFVENRWQQITAVADALLTKRTLNWDQSTECIETSMGLKPFTLSRTRG